jgi:formamidopyrimidine-DNA glycosylase
MPELPDIAAYLSSLETRIVDQPLERIRLRILIADSATTD